MVFKIALPVLTLVTLAAAKVQLEEVLGWKQLEFTWPSAEARDAAIKNGDYIPENNLPLGLDRWNDKLFITVPRWKAGVAASLAFVNLTEAQNNKAQPLEPYPSWKENLLPKDGAKPAEDTIVSTFRVRVDECDRLWVMDTGLADIFGAANQFSKPALVVFDLKTDKLIRRYEFKPTDSKEDSFFANVIVDVSPDKCDQAFAYIPDLGGYGIVVYSWSANDSWRVKHNYFHFDPLNGEYEVGGVKFQWTDGVFGLALTSPNPDGYKTMYFHALSGIREFEVSTEVLRNKTVATDSHSNYFLFKQTGERGPKTQASASFLDEKSGVLFMTQVNKDGVACWDTKKPLNPQNLALVAQDSNALIFPNDLKVDRDENLWVLSDRMPAFLFAELNHNDVNYRIMRTKVQDAIRGTPCGASLFPTHQLRNRFNLVPDNTNGQFSTDGNPPFRTVSDTILYYFMYY